MRPMSLPRRISLPTTKSLRNDLTIALPARVPSEGPLHHEAAPFDTRFTPPPSSRLWRHQCNPRNQEPPTRHSRAEGSPCERTLPHRHRSHRRCPSRQHRYWSKKPMESRQASDRQQTHPHHSQPTQPPPTRQRQKHHKPALARSTCTPPIRSTTASLPRARPMSHRQPERQSPRNRCRAGSE